MHLLLLIGIYMANYDGVCAVLTKSLYVFILHGTTWRWSLQLVPTGKDTYDAKSEPVAIGCERAADTSYVGSIRIDGGASKRKQKISIKASWNPRTQTTYIKHLFLHDIFRNSDLHIIFPLDQVLL